MRRTIEKIKERKAITLIALVVTIVVILILAGITVGMVTSDNGILKETKNAKEQAEIDNEKSIVERAKMLAMMRSKNGAITYEIFEPALKDEAGKMSTDVSNVGDTIEVLFKDSNRYYEIDQDGNVSEPQEVVKDEYAGDTMRTASMFSCTVSSSMRLKLWNTNPNMPLRNSFRFDSLQEDTSFPSSIYCPEDGLSNRPRM